MNKTKLITALILLCLILPAGCVIHRPIVPESGHYYINPGADFTTIGKVVVFELENNSNKTGISMPLTQALTESIQKKHIFSLTTLEHTDPAWQNLDLARSQSFSFEELAAIRSQLNADAVLFGSITRYQPFPHIMMGLHLKLIDLRNGKLVWAFEQIWDSTDKRTENRMRQFYCSKMRTGYQPMDWRLLITSPKAFNKFTVHEVAQTLPEGNPYMQAYHSSEKSRNIRIKSPFLEKTLEIPQETLKLTKEISTIGL